MSQVASPPATVRPATATPAATGAPVTPSPTDQAAGQPPRHHGAGGQPTPQQPQAAPPPPAVGPAVTLSGALTALFSGQPVTATVAANANGQLVLRLPEAQLVVQAQALEAAQGDVLALKLVASGPTPTIIVTGRNGRPVTDPAPLPVSIEAVPETPPATLPMVRRPAPPPAAIATAPEPVPVALATRPAAATAAPPAKPVPPPAAAPTAPSAPPVLVPVLVDAESLLPPVAEPEAVAPAARPVITPAAAPVVAKDPAEPRPTIDQAPPPAPGQAPKGQVPPPRAMAEPARIAAPASARTEAITLEPMPLRTAVANAPARTENDAAPVRPSLREAPMPTVPAPARPSAQRPSPFIPPEVPTDAPRPSTAAHPANLARSPAPPVQASVTPASPPSHAAPPRAAPEAAAAAPAKPAAPAPAPTSMASTALPELAPIEVEPMPPEDAPVDRRAASAWTALWATVRADPVAAERIRDMLQPRAGGRLGGGLAFLVAALRGGGLATWLGAEDSARIDLPSRPDSRRTVEAEFRDLARMAQERGPDGWRATPLAVLDAGAVQPVMLYVHRPPRRRKTDPGLDEAAERFMLDLRLSRAGPMRIDGLLRPKALDVIIRTEKAVPSRIQRELRQVFTTSLEGAGLGGTLGFQKVDRLPPPPAMTADGKPHHAVLA